MIFRDLNEDLINSLSESILIISKILKCLGNEKRLNVLIYLLKGPLSYGNIVKKINLKKTAVSNHLTHLIEEKLIERDDYGIYKITGDGLEFLKAINKAFYESPTRMKEKFESMQSRKVSDSFLRRYTG
ncbi:MAG: winged helix-turn-helix transcriptional regulator [Candidatus Lokiarchaeota archaeon]|nr:winged helix-turn-helix transcriptional regulator [Candidatus Lokiarchaeota archaeon]